VTPLSTERAREILDAASGVRVLVVGDLMLDRYISGTVDRISPEAPVPVVRVLEESSAVGGAANVAANAVALGAVCQVVGCVGSDAGGDALRGALLRLGVGVEGVVEDPSRRTTVKTRVLARSQQVVRVDFEEDGDVSPVVQEALQESIRTLARAAHVVVLEDYNKGVLVPGVIHAAMQAAAGREVPTVVDPKKRNFFGFSGASVFKPNAKELEEALAAPLHPDDPEWMEETRARLGCGALLLTLGERGMALQAPPSPHLRIPALARSVFDVSGAGDTVTAVVAVALAAGAHLQEAALLANHAAAIEVGKAGVATVSPAELLEHLSRPRP